MTDEIKPCPFCGHEVPQWIVGAAFGGHTGIVFCVDCGAEGPESMPVNSEQQARRLAVEAWNKRAT